MNTYWKVKMASLTDILLADNVSKSIIGRALVASIASSSIPFFTSRGANDTFAFKIQIWVWCNSPNLTLCKKANTQLFI